MFIRLRELTSDSCQSMANIAIYVNLYTRIRAVRPSTCNVMCNTFGHLIRAPHYFQTDVFLSTIPTLTHGLTVKVRDLEVYS